MRRASRRDGSPSAECSAPIHLAIPFFGFFALMVDKWLVHLCPLYVKNDPVSIEEFAVVVGFVIMTIFLGDERRIKRTRY